ncbi:UDP-N-acetylmuramoyl-L-alanine--D-glutamate ligase [Streptomyces sp. NP160]|uniref:UDP-N-acetylmuramoyl-L-alanine--D-glutamate ligase n=1 Tax=Streptomyces sp. NP160 TaxID=2586637 RepID=UPI00111A277E|nr:UDP-N-acetylmuramoyl-L-alanine--D-glutamate ligase [Streptomyces sp. NP160]TNM63293.1 UDP-N-acetylmuramoyl-L-alanine--D-glutamate ligase [Streptomyces sp. NP160]
MPAWRAGSSRVPERGPADWEGLRVVVAGFAVSGAAAAYALAERGAKVLAVDSREGAGEQERAKLLDVLGGRVALGPGASDALHTVDGNPPDLVIASPGWRPSAPLLAQAARAGIPVWGEVELAWRLRGTAGPVGAPVGPASSAPWLCVTGTNGKTTTTTMLASILRAHGLRATTAGNIGTPLVEAVLDPAGADVLAVELSSFQLHGAHTLAPRASAVLNLAADHLDWHGSMGAYAADKGRIYTDTERACVYNADERPDGQDWPTTEQLVVDADVQEGCRAIGFTLGVPGLSMLGVVDDVLADRAYVADRANSAAELCTLADLADASGGVVAPHVVANALAAAALARAHGVSQQAVRDGLLSTRPGAHRIAVVARSGGVAWVDDSKATNAHAAAASLAGAAAAAGPDAHDGTRVVWVAGGLAKGAQFDDLVGAQASRLRAAVLIGTDREPLRGALERRAPGVPVVEVDAAAASAAGGVMPAAVRAAAAAALPGDVVLLAPASASMDQFSSYAERGDAFAAAVRALLDPSTDDSTGSSTEGEG